MSGSTDLPDGAGSDEARRARDALRKADSAERARAASVQVGFQQFAVEANRDGDGDAG